MMSEEIAAESIEGHRQRTVDPIMTLQVPTETSRSKQASLAMGSRSSVSAVCFLQNINTSPTDLDSSSESSDSDGEGELRCTNLLRRERLHDEDVTSGARDAAASMTLQGTILASCHSNSDAYMWDLGRQRIAGDFGERRGPGLALRRLGGSSACILFHTRDEAGTVSIHDAMRVDNPIVTTYETESLTFCSASPCNGNGNLVVLPEDQALAVVRDVRIPQRSSPVCRLHGAALDGHISNDRKHGMLNSLAMAESELTGRLCVACGMESGTVFFHDLATTARPSQEQASRESSHEAFSSVKLGKDPVLSVDLASSSKSESFVAIAGLAGDAAELSGVPDAERGTIGVIKTTMASPNRSGMSARLRARMGTCIIGGPDDVGGSGKPGVGICRFRPDGRCFAVGGWDKRVRVFDRAGKATPLAVLKTHGDSVTALDWAPDVSSGLIASGADDGRIPIWRCFSSTQLT